MDSITITTTGGDLSQLTPDKIKQGFENLSKAIKKGLPPGMEAVTNDDSPITQVFSYSIPHGVILANLKHDEEERRHREIVEATREPAQKTTIVNLYGQFAGSLTVGDNNTISFAQNKQDGLESDSFTSKP